MKRPRLPRRRKSAANCTAAELLERGRRMERNNRRLDILYRSFLLCFGAWFIASVFFSEADWNTRVYRFSAGMLFAAAAFNFWMTNRAHRRAKQKELELDLITKALASALSDYTWGEALMVTVFTKMDLHEVASDIHAMPKVKGVVPAGMPPWLEEVVGDS